MSFLCYFMIFTISRKKLIYDLYYAFFCAKKYKANKDYVKHFEKNLHNNIIELADEIMERRYKPQPSVCFIISRPKKREIFAANFRDRVVHHLYYNYTYELFDNTFIEDSYSCRVGKGTHYGIERLERHIRSASENYSKKTYILKLDIKGYFIHINRKKLLEITEKVLDKMKTHRVSKNEPITWEEKIDYDLVKYLNHELVLLNPIENCVFKSDKIEWYTLDKSKSLFYSKENQGLPIGNLTSQLLSNVYLNLLDQYIKRELKCKHYGRYVDDFYIVDNDKEKLKRLIEPIKNFLENELDLSLNLGKTKIRDVNIGVDFLGAYLKPWRRYISNECLKRMVRQLYEIEHIGTDKNIDCQINSFLGVLSHYKTYNIKKILFNDKSPLNEFGRFNEDYTKFIVF